MACYGEWQSAAGPEFDSPKFEKGAFYLSFLSKGSEVITSIVLASFDWLTSWVDPKNGGQFQGHVWEHFGIPLCDMLVAVVAVIRWSCVALMGCCLCHKRMCRGAVISKRFFRCKLQTHWASTILYNLSEKMFVSLTLSVDQWGIDVAVVGIMFFFAFESTETWKVIR